MPINIHEEAELWAAAATAGGLSETERKAWCDHLAACPTCQKLYEEEIAMVTLIENTLQPECPDPGFERRIVAKFRQTYAGKGSRWNEFLRLLSLLIGTAACLVLMAVTGIGWLVQGEKPSLATTVSPGSGVQLLPLAVQKTLQNELAGRIVGKVERIDDHGEVSYNIDTKSPDGEQWGLTVAEDGTLLSAETTLAALPAVVQSAIKTAVGEGTLQGIDKTFDDGEVSYTAGISTNGREHDFTFDEDGTLSSQEVDLADLTPVIGAAINQALGHDKLEGIDKTFDDGKITYEAAVVAADGRERTVVVSNTGELLSREVTLTEAPAAVRQTISKTLGDGKLEEIDQSFVTVDHVMPYKIEGQKDGKPFDFMVGPEGNFLGMED